jgi:hypothetical protein
VLTGDAAHPDAHAHAQHAAAEDTHTHDDDGEAQEILSDGDDAALSAWLDDPDTGVSGSDAVDAAFAMFAGGEDDDGLFGFLDEPDTTTLTPTEPKKTVAAPDSHAHTGTRLTDEFSVFEDNMPSTSTLNVCIAGLGTRVCVCVNRVYVDVPCACTSIMHVYGTCACTYCATQTLTHTHAPTHTLTQSGRSV